MKKTYFALMISFLLLLTTFIGGQSLLLAEEVVTSDYWSNSTDSVRLTKGDGTTENPYIISSEGELAFLTSEEAKTDEFMNANYRLEADLDMLKHYFTPIGSFSKPFSGTFDGNGYTISNLRFLYESSLTEASNTNKAIGLFGAVKGLYISESGLTQSVKIQNLKVNDIQIDYNIPNNDNIFIGGLVGSGDKVEFLNVTADNVKANIRSNAQIYFGGICGRAINASRFTNTNVNFNEAKVTQGGVQTYGFLGGICGQITNSKIYNSIASGKLIYDFIADARFDTSMGGIVGSAYNDSEIINTLNSVNLSVASTITAGSMIINVGGVVGGFKTSYLVPQGAVNYNYYYSNTNVNTDLAAISNLAGYNTNSLVLQSFSDEATVKTSSFYTKVENWDILHEWDFASIWEVGESGLPQLQVNNMYLFRFISDDKLNRVLLDEQSNEIINHITEDQAKELGQDVNNIKNIYYIKYGTEILVMFEVLDNYKNFYNVTGLTLDNEIVTTPMSQTVYDNKTYTSWQVQANNMTVGLYQAATEAQKVKNVVKIQPFNIGSEDEPKYDKDTGMVKNENGDSQQESITQNMSFGDTFTYNAIAGSRYAFSHWKIEYVTYKDDGTYEVNSTVDGATQTEESILRKQKITFVFGQDTLFDKQFILTAVFSDNTMDFKISFISPIIVKLDGTEIVSGEPIKIVYRKKLSIEITVPNDYTFDIDKLANTIANQTNLPLKEVYDKDSLDFHYKDLDNNDVYKIYYDTSKVSKTEEGITLETNISKSGEGGSALTWIIVGVSLGLLLIIGGVVVTIIIIKKRGGGGGGGYKGAFF